jgi:hypothetical protein
VEFIGKDCFYDCKLLCEVAFAGSKLQLIEENAFCWTGVRSINVPSSVEFIGKGCFRYCQCLSKVIFKPGSKLQRIEDLAFAETGL